MEVHLDADMLSVHERLKNAHQHKRGLENLRRLFSGEPPLPVPKHVYVQKEGCGIGFCTQCHSDDINDGNHLLS